MKLALALTGVGAEVRWRPTKVKSRQLERGGNSAPLEPQFYHLLSFGVKTGVVGVVWRWRIWRRWRSARLALAIRLTTNIDVETGSEGA